MLACLGRTGVGGATELRSDGLVGARVPWAEDNHWIDAAVADPGAELAGPPHCVWSTVVPARRLELAEIAMPCMGLELDDRRAESGAPIDTPPLPLVGELN